jgi:hypothetical protein
MRFTAVLLFALLMGLPAAAAAQHADVITGLVTGPDGRPLSHAQVEALSLETEVMRTVVTGPNGRYTVIFPDGAGRYLLRVTHLGMADVLHTVLREGTEDLLIANFGMTLSAIALDAIRVRARLPLPGRLVSGEQRIAAPLDYLARLALPDLEPETLAQLAAGVITIESDTLNGRARFSVGGMSPELNQLRLDGSVIGPETGGFSAPSEGVRVTQVTTSSFDPSRGGFAGGQVQLLSQRGSNRAGGTLSYALSDASLQVMTSPAAMAMTRHNLGGSYGGPVIENKLFYNASFQLIRTLDHRFALATHDPMAAQRSGVAADSISRFLDIMADTYGFATAGQTGAYNQQNADVRLQARFDWNIVQTAERAQTLTARFNINHAQQDSTRINVLDLSQHGGDSDRNTRLAGITLTSRFGRNWTNTLNTSYGETWNESIPYIEMPEGQVRVTSDFEDGTRGTRSIVFGGNRNMPTEANNRDFQLSNEVTWMLPIGATQIHRLKLGGSVQRMRDVARSTDNLFGTFTYASLADFEENRPDRYERSLATRETQTGRFLAALYLGDSWRVTAPLEVTAGIRWDYSRYDQRPAYNTAIDSVFSRRTDEMPVVGTFSPRLGFNYRLSPQVRGARMRALNGGIGVFAGRAPTSIFSAALRQTGLPDGEQRLVCIGASVPIADWDRYLTDPTAVPATCADGGSGFQSSRAPTVTVIAPNQTLPSSLRAELGYRMPLPLSMDGNVRYSFSRGYGLWGYRDLNLDAADSFQLGGEGRPFYGDPLGIVQRTGAVSLATSRLDRGFANVYEVSSDRSSLSHQVSLQASGRVRPPTQINANYTLSFTRDNGSGAFTQVPTAGNPNTTEWATAPTDRRHTLNLTLTHAITPEVEFATTTRLSSGLPFTPIVNRDINGDGSRNDRAFVFDPATADTAVAHGMLRLLDQVPGRVRSCIESQFGSIAGRNTCRESWTQGLDMRLNVRPNLPRVERRMTVSFDVQNVLTGLDAALHGRDNARGWGEGQRAENILLNVRGFDRETLKFRYEVNESFGQARRGTNAARNAFTVNISGRLLVGAQARTGNRGFGQQGSVAAGSGGSGGGGTGGGAAFGPFTALLRTTNPTANVDSVMDVAFLNPLRAVLEAEGATLDAEQRTAVAILLDSLDAKLAVHREAARPVVDSLLALRAAAAPAAAAPEVAAAAAPGSAAGAHAATVGQRYQSDLAPRMDVLRRDVLAARQALQQLLTPEQWAALPRQVQQAGSPPRSGGQGPPAAQGGSGGG